MPVQHTPVYVTEAERLEQENAARQVRDLPERPRTYHIVTYGCQMNAHDSEKLAGILSGMGMAEAADRREADLVIFNTCCVRDNAERRALGNVTWLKELKKDKPGLIIGVCGCMVQQPGMAERILRQYRFIDLAFGTHNLHRLPSLLLALLTQKTRVVSVTDEENLIAEDLPVKRLNAWHAYITIMYGCDNFCSYCIVPYVRGRERSRNPEELYSEVRQLVEDGVKEITLLGQNVNSYGKDLPKPLSFAELLRNICRIEGDFTLRFMTSHPKDATKELIDVMAENPKIAKAFHLPLQSGSNRILQRMNRHYTAESYLSLVSYMRKKMPDIALTSDIIVGFPGESEEDFEATLEVLEKAEYDNIYSFIYSPRKGTPAAEMPDQIPPEVSSARFARLLEKQMEISNRKNKDYTGCVLKVLVEGHSKTDESKLTGRSEKNRLVHFEGPDELVGQYAHVRITRTETFALFGILEK